MTGTVTGAGTMGGTALTETGGEMDTLERREERGKHPRKDLSFPWHRGLNPRRRLRVELLNPASLEELSLWIRLRRKKRLKRNCRKRKRRKREPRKRPERTSPVQPAFSVELSLWTLLRGKKRWRISFLR